jgi:hypothetical protein
VIFVTARRRAECNGDVLAAASPFPAPLSMIFDPIDETRPSRALRNRAAIQCCGPTRRTSHCGSMSQFSEERRWAEAYNVGGRTSPAGMRTRSMKNANACPKCQAKDIIRIPGWVGGYGSGNNIPVKTFSLGMSGWVPVARYVCSRCGYTEEWIDNKDDIEKLKKKYALGENGP